MARPKVRKISTNMLEGYNGKKAIIETRSGWEITVIKMLEKMCQVKAIQGYSSEEFVVPYICGTDGNPHRYFTDFLITKNNGDKIVVEVKPNQETIQPFKPRNFKSDKQKRNYDTSMLTYIKNTSKWKATIEECKNLTQTTGENWSFAIWVEKNKKNPSDKGNGIIKKIIPV